MYRTDRALILRSGEEPFDTGRTLIALWEEDNREDDCAFAAYHHNSDAYLHDMAANPEQTPYITVTNGIMGVGYYRHPRGHTIASKEACWRGLTK